MKVLSEQEKQEVREAIERWAKAAKETAKHDPEFAKVLRKTPFYGLAMRAGDGKP